MFSTFAPTQFLSDDPALLFGGTRAHNRAMVDFCRDDARLLPVGFVPWGTPELTFQAAKEAIDLGCAAILVPSVPARDGVSPTHPDHHPLWALLQDADVPFVLHIGGGGRLTRPVFHRNGIEVTDFLGGGENIRAKDYIGISHPPEMFLAAMVFDGILEKFPNLRGGSIEQGALWVVPWMRKLDLAQRTFGRTEPVLRDLALSPSEYVRRQLRFTPFPGEPVGWMIEQAGDELFCFSSDYPHPEGTRDPIGRFETTLAASTTRHAIVSTRRTSPTSWAVNSARSASSNVSADRYSARRSVAVGRRRARRAGSSAARLASANAPSAIATSATVGIVGSGSAPIRSTNVRKSRAPASTPSGNPMTRGTTVSSVACECTTRVIHCRFAPRLFMIATSTRRLRIDM